MFGIGLGEVLVLAAIGVLVFGPDRCVKLSKDLGRWWKKLNEKWTERSFDDADGSSE
jgi:Sec-independent protein translocase protein TatA